MKKNKCTTAQRGRRPRSSQPNYPYSYEVAPWLYRLIQYSHGGGSVATVFTVSNLLTALKGYLTSTSSDLQIRVKKIEIWSIASVAGTDSGKYPSVDLDVYSTIPRLNDVATGEQAPFYNILSRKRDTGTLNRPAKVHYKWPVQYQVPLGEESDSQLFATAGTPSTIYVHILFRIGGEAAPIAARQHTAIPREAILFSNHGPPDEDSDTQL